MQRFFVVNVRKMQDQSNHFRNEKVMCDRLSSKIKSAQSRIAQEKKSSYNSVINQVNQLSTFYQKMANVLDETGNMISSGMTEANMNFEDIIIINQKKFDLSD